MKKIIWWVLGIIFVLFGFRAIGAGFILGGSLVLISGIAIIPPIKERFKLPVFVSVLVLFSGLWFSVSKMQEDITNEYEKNKNKIILSIKDKIEKKDYNSAISESEKYLITKDKDVEDLNLKAINLKKEIERLEEENIEKQKNTENSEKLERKIRDSVNNEHWYLNGKSVAKIDAENFTPKNISHGLVVDCWETSGKMRVWIKDFVVANKEIIYYETDSYKGLFRANKRYIAAPDPTKDRKETKKLIKALINSSYINFKSKGVYNGEDIDSVESKGIKITYSLNGSNSIIKSLKCTERYLK